MVRYNLEFENVRIFSRNFAGKANKFNNEGNRNFCVIIEDHQYAKKLLEDGWNIKYLEPREPDDEAVPFLQVSVKFGDYPPTIYLVNSFGKTRIGEEEIGILDWAEIVNTDLTIRPYNWTIGNKQGTKAFVKYAYFTIADEPFADKYSNIPDSAQRTMTEGF